MIHLLKIEWLKLKKYRTFYILSGLFASIFVAINLVMRTAPISVNIGKGMKASLLSDTYSFSEVWNNLGYYYGWAIIFICVLVIVNICNEFSFKTQRQHIIDGYHRLDFLHGKVMLILAINIALVLFLIIVGLIFGYTNGGGNPMHRADKIFHVFILGLNYISFSALVALFIRRSGLSIMLLLAFVFVEHIISMVSAMKFDTAIMAYLPLESSDALFTMPLNPLAKQATDMIPQNNLSTLLIMSGVFIFLYYVIARWRMLKADL
jgi:hypothetical protein